MTSHNNESESAVLLLKAELENTNSILEKLLFVVSRGLGAPIPVSKKDLERSRRIAEAFQNDAQ